MDRDNNRLPPVDWWRRYYQKNKKYFLQEPGRLACLDWSKPGLMVGPICLGAVSDSIVCFAADDRATGESFLAINCQLIENAILHFGPMTELDEAGLVRVEISVAYQVARALYPSSSHALHSIPFDAFLRYMDARGSTLVEKNAAVVAWRLAGMLEGDLEQHAAACRVKPRGHRDLREEMAMSHSLPDLSADRSASGWESFRVILERWVDPQFDTDSYATNFQDLLAALLVLFWAKYRLGGIDRRNILDTYLGESLNPPP